MLLYMNIHPLWAICILVRLSLLIAIRKLYKNETFKAFATAALAVMGTGFIYKAFSGSNDEVQIADVFWHETRYIHGILYLFAAYYLYIGNINMNTAVLGTDLGFSILYRTITGQ